MGEFTQNEEENEQFELSKFKTQKNCETPNKGGMRKQTEILPDILPKMKLKYDEMPFAPITQGY